MVTCHVAVTAQDSPHGPSWGSTTDYLSPALRRASAFDIALVPGCSRYFRKMYVENAVFVTPSSQQAESEGVVRNSS